VPRCHAPNPCLKQLPSHRTCSATLPRSEPLPTTTTEHYTTCCKKPQSFAPEDGQKFAWNMLSWSWRSIKLLLLHLVGFYFTLTGHSSVTFFISVRFKLCHKFTTDHMHCKLFLQVLLQEQGVAACCGQETGVQIWANCNRVAHNKPKLQGLDRWHRYSSVLITSWAALKNNLWFELGLKTRFIWEGGWGMYQNFVGQASIDTECNCCKSQRDT